MARSRRKNKKQPKKKETQVDALKMVTAGIGDLMLVSEMEELVWTPTLLTGYNRATGIGGHPLGRVMVVHGPNQVGKSVFAMIIGESLRRAGHVSKVDEVEWAAEKVWYNLISPESILDRPRTLDDMRDTLNRMLDNLEKAKKARKKAERLPENVGLALIIDTLTMLWPKKILEKVEAEGIDKMYPLKALWITDWMNEVVPRIRRSNSSLILVMQERQNMNKKSKFDKDWHLPGGTAIQYDNCLRVRVTSASKVKRGEIVVGMESKYEVGNNKVDGTTWEKASFFTSNGRGDTPKGLDLVREAISEARRREIMKHEGNCVTAEALTKHGEPVEMFTVKGGWENMRLALTEDQAKFDLLVSELNRMARREP
jgi:RecA/RadA recombinase